MNTATITGNERLRGAMVAANVTIEGLAAHLDEVEKPVTALVALVSKTADPAPIQAP
ncbi:hypothetical protein OHA60_17155 [Streptomyces cellulosae]|nr:hypothetical protein OHA60_17155 [Streptomyces cellulosae]